MSRMTRSANPLARGRFGKQRCSVNPRLSAPDEACCSWAHVYCQKLRSWTSKELLVFQSVQLELLCTGRLSLEMTALGVRLRSSFSTPPKAICTTSKGAPQWNGYTSSVLFYWHGTTGTTEQSCLHLSSYYWSFWRFAVKSHDENHHVKRPWRNGHSSGLLW